VVTNCHANHNGAYRALPQRNPAIEEVLKTFTEDTDQEMADALTIGR
jgi:hypothetical protein